MTVQVRPIVGYILIFILHVYLQGLAQALGRCSNCRYGSDYCDVDNTCLFGCQPGFQGHNCSLPCTIKNCVECYRLSTTQEQCSMCRGNVYGPLCNLHCNKNCRGLSTTRSSCDTQGDCIFGCESGYHGNKCDEIHCPYEHCSTCGVDWSGQVYCEKCAREYYWHTGRGCIRCSEYCATPYDCSPYNGHCNSGCRTGRFGDQCENRCDIPNCSSCYKVSGIAALCRQCDDGFYPSYNQRACLPCREECVKCSPATGDCTECPEGQLGNRCQHRCDIDGCDKCTSSNGIVNCTKCKLGYYSLRDMSRPSTHRYICQNCSSTCEGGVCYQNNGNCVKCAKGYYGRPSETTGTESCRFRCSENCVTEECDPDDGSCQCKPGWFGSLCTRSCPRRCTTCDGYENGNRRCPSCEPGYFGDACDKQCPSTCESRSTSGLPTCHQDTGSCDFGCYSGFYGSFCNESCSQSCDGWSCDRNTGYCQAGCTAYWYGKKCDQRCSSNCIADGISSINRPCDMTTGRCFQGCKENYYGDRCDKTCNYRCREQKCFQETGICKYGCMTGFTGLNCSEQCGQNCPEDCPNCAGKYCDVVTRNCLHGCVKGFYGPKCQYNCGPKCKDRSCDGTTGVCNQCEAGFYGEKCPSQCSPKCLNGVCDMISGRCRQCLMGHYGDTCNLKCPSNCKTQDCGQDSGKCENGCIAGYFGDHCDTECWGGWYGEDCTMACGRCQDSTPCRRTDGHCISGCDVGFGGDTCKQSLKEGGPAVYDEERVALIAGTSVSAILVVCIIITVAILCYCRSQRARKAKREEPSVCYTTSQNSVQVVQAGSSILQTESEVSLHQIESNLLGSMEPEIRCTGIVAHRDYYILHRGLVVRNGEKEETYVKVLLLNDTVEKQTHLSWLTKEVEILEKCKSHPNIVSFLAAHQKPERLCVALSNCMQNNLVPYLHEINLSDPEDIASFYDHQLIQFAIDVSDALCHIHRHKIIHRYLRARSIYLSDNLVAKVGDFDFAILVEDSTAEEQRGRDLPSAYSCWLSPEALISNVYSTQSDIWSYGILLWEIFTLGQHPFDRLEGNKLERAIVDGQRPPKPALASVAMYRLMKNCWRYSPEDRPRAEGVICHLTETQEIQGSTSRIVIQV